MTSSKLIILHQSKFLFQLIIHLTLKKLLATLFTSRDCKIDAWYASSSIPENRWLELKALNQNYKQAYKQNVSSRHKTGYIKSISHRSFLSA